ncbi:hypothetical protein PI124_g12758 [Phytophthora idaei]|nr:hypothetical protein PI125_g20652 [Phytophthora idaei]KAG3142134.1 hypothetical protein PI126_g15180 [Phytophthora idaei]KAG3242390.1 hypothetical protein PI124_g12758 [Phytophthora idaei]
MLSEGNMTKRIAFCVEHVSTATHLFDEMEDVVHIDEKLFYMSKIKRRFVLLPDEPAPVHRLKSKRHIPKVMVLAAVARPRYDPTTGEFFDGKLGVWDFFYTRACKTQQLQQAKRHHGFLLCASEQGFLPEHAGGARPPINSS